ncbi:hypothetical protein [Streptomyces atriruber]|uniref:hypothetical protein n=1 Tax=Streptomyces atriruber TaxID=545121 RepID=UPI0006E387C4|nr:hypothetical protein [Streptomyces atriruber]
MIADRGLRLWSTLCMLGAWGRDNFTEGAPHRVFRHAECGTELGAVGDCPACGYLVPPADVEMLPDPGLDPDPVDPVSRALARPRRLLQPVEADPV